MNHKAMYWEVEGNKIRCQLCPQFCLIKVGHLGLCQTRKNVNQQLMAINYGEITSIALDPIEKKPLYHYKPGSNILSVGTYGCNMKCGFCQNHSISQNKAESRYIPINELLKILDSVENNIGIAFTYNEPFMWYEYIYDICSKIKEKNKEQSIVMVTNGYINPEPLKKIISYIDGFNIDLKAFNPSFYHKICKADLKPVLKTIEIAQKECHVEVTTLMITDENDSIDEIESIAQFLSNLNRDIPLHLTRYYPNYKMKNPPTDIQKMILAKEKAKQHLNYVYLGNIPNEDTDTYCPSCGKQIIDRQFHTKVKLNKNKCIHCGKDISIVF